jgi:hypothetical protein
MDQSTQDQAGQISPPAMETERMRDVKKLAAFLVGEGWDASYFSYLLRAAHDNNLLEWGEVKK